MLAGTKGALTTGRGEVLAWGVQRNNKVVGSVLVKKIALEYFFGFFQLGLGKGSKKKR